MHLRRIKVLAVVVPTAGLVGYEGFRHFVLQPAMGEQAPHLDEHIVSAIVLLSGVVVFTFVVFRLLERLHGQLVALNEAAITVTADLSVDRVLERVAELAGTVAGAAYASVQAEGEPGKAVSSGAARPGEPTLELPIVVKGKRLGELVLAGPPGKRFRSSDRGALETFATQAGIALENAHLFEQIQDLAAFRERSRIGMDLHDGVIQELYALGLKVEDAAELASTAPEDAATELRDAQALLQGVIGEIRSFVYELRDGDRSVEVRPALERLVGEFPSGRTAISLEASDARLPATTAANVLYVVREALANALRHAAASHVLIRATRDDGALSVSVRDDGRGFDPTAPSTGMGLRDLRERAGWCRSELEIRSAPGDGTLVRLVVPTGAAGNGGGPR